jgi:hypothetical protein
MCKAAFHLSLYPMKPTLKKKKKKEREREFSFICDITSHYSYTVFKWDVWENIIKHNN